MPNCNRNNNLNEKSMKNKRTRMRVAHITLCDLLTTLDPIDNHSSGISESIESNNIHVELCQVRIYPRLLKLFKG